MSPSDGNPPAKSDSEKGDEQSLSVSKSDAATAGVSSTMRYVVAATTLSVVVSLAVLGVMLKSRQQVASNPPATFSGADSDPQPPAEKQPPTEKTPPVEETAPVKPDPVKSDPVKPDPVKPDPVKPDPVKPDPVKPDPVKPDPVKSDPVKPGGTMDAGPTGTNTKNGIFGGGKPNGLTPATGGPSVGTSKTGGIFGGIKPTAPKPGTGGTGVGTTKTGGGIFGGIKTTGITNSSGTSSSGGGKSGTMFGGGKPPINSPTGISNSGTSKGSGGIFKPPTFVTSGIPWNGGFTNSGGTLVTTVVNPGPPIITISPTNQLGGGFIVTYGAKPKQPVPPQFEQIWDLLLSQSILEILNRLSLGGGNGISGPIAVSGPNLSGTTFVRKGFLGLVVGRMSFTNSTFTSSLPGPAQSGNYVVTSNRLTLTPTSPVSAPRSMALSGFQMVTAQWVHDRVC